MWRRFPPIRQAKLNLLRFIRLKGSPEYVAKGMALGIFIGMTPTFGMQMLIAAGFALIFKQHKIAAILGVWITNPITAPAIYALEYETGRLILNVERARLPLEFTLSSLKSLSWEILGPMCLGSLLYGVICAGIAYAVTFRFLPLAKSWRVTRWPRPRGKREGKQAGGIERGPRGG